MTAAAIPSDETITTGEVARLLGVSDRTVQRLSDRGFLPAARLAPYSPRRYRREDVERLLEQVRGTAA